jgi:hypothetical protein
MILALFFLPVALVVITIGLPVLIFLVSVGAMCIVAYQQFRTWTTFSITEGPPHSSESSNRFYEYDGQSRSISPPPTFATIPELRLSPSLSYHPKYTCTSTLKSPYEMEVDVCDFTSAFQPRQRHCVRFS